MKTIINGQVTLSRPLEGPLASQITAFAKWSDAQGYSPYSLYRHVLMASDFSRWLGRQGMLCFFDAPTGISSPSCSSGTYLQK